MLNKFNMKKMALIGSVNSPVVIYLWCNRPTSTTVCARVHCCLINYVTICTFRHPYVHPGTAAVNQTVCSFAVKGRAFATDIHSIYKSHQMNIKNNIKKKIRNSDYCYRWTSRTTPRRKLGILTIATGIF